MAQTDKASISRAYGRTALCVFDRDGNLYTHTRRLLSHAVDDAKVCGGEIWVNGRCTLPAWNVCGHDFRQQPFEGPAMKCVQCGKVEH